MDNMEHNNEYNEYLNDLAELEAFFNMQDMQSENIISDFKSSNIKDIWELMFNTDEIYVYQNIKENIYRIISKSYINNLFNI